MNNKCCRASSIISYDFENINTNYILNFEFL